MSPSKFRQTKPPNPDVLSAKYTREIEVKNGQCFSGINNSLYMFFPVVQGTIGRWASSWTFIKHDTIFPTYEVQGKVFENVLRVHDTGNGAYSAQTKFYHAKHIGVIRKEIYEMDSDPYNPNPNPKLLQVWELVDYKIIQ